MQDMATLQQPVVTSPAPAPPGAARETSAVAGGGEARQETSRTDAGSRQEDEEASRLDHQDEPRGEEASEEKTDGEDEEGGDEDDYGGSREYLCPICDAALGSQHDFTLHIRSHNGSGEAVAAAPPGGFVCRVCGKALSSGSSLDRHVLVHSGERPFRCRVCGVSFTTNGNMHRHLRTHGEDGASPVEAKRRRLSSPAPAGDADRRRALDLSQDGEDSARRKHACPVCCRVDFASLNVLETHLEEMHPEYKARCHLCNLVFKNHRALNLHRTMKHFGEAGGGKAAPVLGFRDLTFVDFSSDKFPIIARAVCEQSLHRATSAFHRFQCGLCARAFPCGKALAIHRQSCDGVREARLRDCESEEDERKQDDFLARLDLRTKSASLSPPPDYPRRDDGLEGDSYFTGGRDLADIQSILSLTSAGGLLQELCSSPRPRSDTTPPDSAAKSSDSGHGEDEQQDCFAAEFRRMKLKGEFPCRLCAAVFPNLRALKGHNRVHLAASGGLPRCNMCPFASPDKAVVVRHMRTHNGDRPYECALCNYAFTTKANCERHLRNRHSQLPKDEVKNYIIYHPSEDPTNDPGGQGGQGNQGKALSARDDVKRALVFSGQSDEGSRTDVQEPQDEDSSRSAANHVPKKTSPSQNRLWETHEVATMTHFADDEEMQDSDDNQTVSDDSVLVNLTKNNNLIKNALLFKRHSEDQRIFLKDQVRTSNLCMQFVKKCYEQYNDENDVEDNAVEDEDVDEDNVPLDLSMDALDLSKKKPISSVQLGAKDVNETQPQDLSRKPLVHSMEFSRNTPVQSVFAPPYKSPITTINIPPANSPAIYKSSLSPGSLGANPMPKVERKSGNLYPGHALYLNNNGYFSAQPLFQVPYLMSSHNHNLFTGSNLQDFAEMKERLHKELIRGLKLGSGGTLLDTATMAEMCARTKPEVIIDYPESKVKMECAGNAGLSPTIDSKEGIINNLPATPPKLTASPKPVVREKDTSASVKMVIKNGVLMPKQKQRRYRTERPFSCEFCSARFTLRSNMERHIKQQHPQCWSQRQKNGGSLGRRGHGGAPAHSQDSRSSLDSLGHVDLSVPSLDSERNTKVEEAPRPEPEPEHKPYISEEVKLAIAQKLSQPCAGAVKAEDEEEDEDGLVIDEEPGDQPASRREDGVDLASVSRLLDNATTQTRAFRQYFQGAQEEEEARAEGSDDDEEGLVAGSNSEGNNSGSDENRSESETHGNCSGLKKKSAYSLAPNRVSCPYCSRKFPWSSSLRRHVLTHTGQKPFKCPHCPLLFTTKSNCDRHLLRKHAGATGSTPAGSSSSSGGSGGSSAGEASPPAAAGYTMRNVPDRPFKCSACPSSTFSTQSNLRKHLASKHTGGLSGAEDSAGEDCDEAEAARPRTPPPQPAPEAVPAPEAHGPISSSSSSDLPFKCHLCEGGFAERQEALDHIRDQHPPEFQLLESKGALEASPGEEGPQPGHDEGIAPGDEGLEQLRGKFPDYANRKVMCAFCLRRFWSAEDLRRHMRTHTGERPFSCDICRRRFTLKHSMLRHRKKHGPCSGAPPPGDEEPHGLVVVVPRPPPPPDKPPARLTNHNNNNIAPAGDDGYWGPSKEARLLEPDTGLIEKMLDIQDRSIIEQVLLSKSPEDAAKLLGVKNGGHD
ncbi:ras-responsive element-binding protein 1-like [Bacillus rossius redtenbacheri]|uniref:ras-responsive element-binding protein 1-like n=1 Tax=Bacillus rossius redtenbacheri TaxID=93214 RepID=UPI002FDCA024